MSGHGPLAGNAAPVPFEHSPNPHAFLLSILFVSGLAFLFQRAVPGGVSFPQGVMLSLLSGMGVVVISRTLFGDAGHGFMVWAAMGGVGLAVLAVHIGRHLKPSSFGVIRPMNWPVLILVALGFLFVGWSLLMAVVVVPDDWDAWAMWGAKAKVLALGSGPLDEVTRFGQAEYPLMWPSLWAFTGWLAGGWEENWSKGWGAVLLLLTAWQIYIHIARHGSGSGGRLRFLVPVLFVTMPCVALVASWGYAEPAYWLALACAWSGLVELRKHPSCTRAIIAGLMLTAALYVKNEGVVFSVLACAWLLIQRGVGLRQKIILCLVPAILYAPWLVWTRFLLGLETLTTGGMLGLEALSHRMATVLGPAFAKIFTMWFDIRLWGIAGPIVGVLGMWGFWVGKSEERRNLALVGFLFMAYLFAILSGHNDPKWQIGTAWNRLTIHLLLLMVMMLGAHLESLLTLVWRTRSPDASGVR